MAHQTAKGREDRRISRASLPVVRVADNSLIARPSFQRLRHFARQIAGHESGRPEDVIEIQPVSMDNGLHEGSDFMAENEVGVRFPGAARMPYRIVFAGERAAGILAYVSAFVFLITAPSAITDMWPSSRFGDWIRALSRWEQGLFDRIFFPFAGVDLAVFSFVGIFLFSLLFGLANRLRRVRIRATARMDERPAIFLLRSFRDTALQEEPSRFRPLMLAASLTVLPFPLAPLALSKGEERNLINDIDRVLGNAARILMLSPRGVKSAFTVDSHYLEIAVKAELWEQAFLLLAQSSRAIVMIPSATSGILREVELLRRRPDLLKRTVVVLPPVVRKRFTWYGHDRAKGWKTVREAWRASSLSLPAYPEAGMAFSPNQDFSVGRGVSLNGSIGTLGAAVAHLLPSDGNSCSSSSLAMAGIETLTGRSYKKALWSTAIGVLALMVVVVTSSAAIGWTVWSHQRASDQAVIDGATRMVTEGIRTIGSKIRLDPQLSITLALYAWDHSRDKPGDVAKALLAATLNSTFDVNTEYFAADLDPVIRVVPQSADSLIAESQLLLRRFTVTPAIQETWRLGRYKFCVDGRFGIGASGSIALACHQTRTIRVTIGGREKVLPEASHIEAIAIEGERIVWADSANRVVVKDRGREVWRTTGPEKVSQVLLSPDGRYAWIQGASTGVLIDLNHHSPVLLGKVYVNNGAAFAPSGRYFVEGGTLHDLTTGAVREARSNERNAVSAVNSDGSLIAFGHPSGIIEIVDNTGRWPAAKVDGALRGLAFMGNTRRLAGSAGNQIFVFDIEAAQRLRPLIELLDSKAATRRAILAGSEVREIEGKLNLIRGSARKLEPVECENYLDRNPCPAGL